MKKAIILNLYFMIFLFSLWPAGQPEKESLTLTTPAYFSIEIRQEEHSLLIDRQRKTRLKKAPFTLILNLDTTLANHYAAELIISGQDHFFKGLQEGRTLEEILYFAHPESGGVAAADAFRRGAMSVATALFNPEQEMVIHPYNHHGLFYQSEDLHNFSEVIREGSILSCRWTVSRFSDDQGNQSVPLSGLPYSTLYVAVLYLEFSPDGQPVDKQWEYYQLRFTTDWD